MSTITVSDSFTLLFDGTDFIIDDVIYSVPITIVSESPEQITVSLDFDGELSTDNQYIIIGSNNIIIDGLNKTISISSVEYRGLIKNGSDGVPGYTGVEIQNIIINATPDGHIANGKGWICWIHSSNCILKNCSTNGETPNNAGAIVGSFSYNCTATNCFSTGVIKYNAGGIFGIHCSNSTATKCYSKGAIWGSAGGIFGSYCTSSSAFNCYSTGHIMSGSGGIFGANTNYDGVDSICQADGCYSTGTIGGENEYNSGGIFGPDCNTNSTDSTCIALRCFSTGEIYGDTSGSNGGIFGGGAIEGCSAVNCYSIGNIGVGCGGIFSSGATDAVATECYALGTIRGQAGGIFGKTVTDCTATLCYSTASIFEGAGGIFGYLATGSSATKCYTIGAFATFAGTIFGPDSISCTCTDCYVANGLITELFSIASTDSTTINCITQLSEGWRDANAFKTIALANTKWFRVSPNTSFLLASFNHYGGLSPPDYIYHYFLPENITILKNGTSTYTSLTTYYSDQLQYLNQFPQHSSDHPHAINMYGYRIIKKTINTQVGTYSPLYRTVYDSNNF